MAPVDRLLGEGDHGKDRGMGLSVAVHRDLSEEVFGLGSLVEEGSRRSDRAVDLEIVHDSHHIRAGEGDRSRWLVGSHHGEVVVYADDSCDWHLDAHLESM